MYKHCLAEARKLEEEAKKVEWRVQGQATERKIARLVTIQDAFDPIAGTLGDPKQRSFVVSLIAASQSNGKPALTAGSFFQLWFSRSNPHDSRSIRAFQSRLMNEIETLNGPTLDLYQDDNTIMMIMMMMYVANVSRENVQIKTESTTWQIWSFNRLHFFSDEIKLGRQRLNKKKN